MKRKRWLERGTSSVELALIIPVLLLLVFGVVDFARATVLYNTVSEAAREGARAGKITVQPNATPTLAPVLSSAQAATIETAARQHATPVGTLTVTPTTGIDANGPFVRVRVTATFEPSVSQLIKTGSFTVGAQSKYYLP